MADQPMPTHLRLGTDGEAAPAPTLQDVIRTIDGGAPIYHLMDRYTRRSLRLVCKDCRGMADACIAEARIQLPNYPYTSPRSPDPARLAAFHARLPSLTRITIRSSLLREGDDDDDLSSAVAITGASSYLAAYLVRARPHLTRVTHAYLGSACIACSSAVLSLLDSLPAVSEIVLDDTDGISKQQALIWSLQCLSAAPPSLSALTLLTSTESDGWGNFVLRNDVPLLVAAIGGEGGAAAAGAGGLALKQLCISSWLGEPVLRALCSSPACRALQDLEVTNCENWDVVDPLQADWLADHSLPFLTSFALSAAASKRPLMDHDSGSGFLPARDLPSLMWQQQGHVPQQSREQQPLLQLPAAAGASATPGGIATLAAPADVAQGGRRLLQQAPNNSSNNNNGASTSAGPAAAADTTTTIITALPPPPRHFGFYRHLFLDDWMETCCLLLDAPLLLDSLFPKLQHYRGYWTLYSRPDLFDDDDEDGAAAAAAAGPVGEGVGAAAAMQQQPHLQQMGGGDAGLVQHPQGGAGEAGGGGGGAEGAPVPVPVPAGAGGAGAGAGAGAGGFAAELMAAVEEDRREVCRAMGAICNRLGGSADYWALQVGLGCACRRLSPRTWPAVKNLCLDEIWPGPALQGDLSRVASIFPNVVRLKLALEERSMGFGAGGAGGGGGGVDGVDNAPHAHGPASLRAVGAIAARLPQLRELWIQTDWYLKHNYAVPAMRAKPQPQPQSETQPQHRQTRSQTQAQQAQAAGFPAVAGPSSGAGTSATAAAGAGAGAGAGAAGAAGAGAGAGAAGASDGRDEQGSTDAWAMDASALEQLVREHTPRGRGLRREGEGFDAFTQALKDLSNSLGPSVKRLVVYRIPSLVSRALNAELAAAGRGVVVRNGGWGEPHMGQQLRQGVAMEE